MRNILAICSKELYTYFVSPIAYFVIIVFSALSGFIFSLWLISYSGRVSGSDVMQVVFGNLAIILLFFTPVLTMKLFAEERKSGTIELLLTSPITDGQVVIGKFPRELDTCSDYARIYTTIPILDIPFWTYRDRCII